MLFGFDIDRTWELLQQTKEIMQSYLYTDVDSTAVVLTVRVMRHSGSNALYKEESDCGSRLNTGRMSPRLACLGYQLPYK